MIILWEEKWLVSQFFGICMIVQFKKKMELVVFSVVGLMEKFLLIVVNDKLSMVWLVNKSM